MEIEGRVALVTGAASGIGEAIALRLASEGAAVVVSDIDAERGRETVGQIEAQGGRAAFVAADVTDQADVRSMVAFAPEIFGGLDILVNNAGPYISPPYFPEAESERWNRVIDAYLGGTMLAIHHATPLLRERGGGAIVNIASGAGVGYGPHDAVEYAVAKAGVVRLTAALATLEQRMNVWVNCICPGWVDTPMSRRTRSEMTAEELASVPAEMLSAEEVADAAVELVRDDSLAGRVMLYYRPGERRLVPVDAEA